MATNRSPAKTLQRIPVLPQKLYDAAIAIAKLRAAQGAVTDTLAEVFEFLRSKGEQQLAGELAAHLGIEAQS